MRTPCLHTVWEPRPNRFTPRVSPPGLWLLREGPLSLCLLIDIYKALEDAGELQDPPLDDREEGA